MMAARGALWNASIFSPKGKLPWEDVKREYVRKASFFVVSSIFSYASWEEFHSFPQLAWKKIL